MIQIKTTPNLYGISLQGDYQDLYELHESISRFLDLHMILWKDTLPYHEYEYLLSLNYDIRHAYMGTRDVEIIENNADEYGVMAEALYVQTEDSAEKFKKIRTDHKNGNLYFSVDILYPLVFHYLITFEDLLIYEVPETSFPVTADHLMDFSVPEDYSNIDALYDRSQVRLFTTLLWKNVQSLLGREKAQAIYSYYLESDPLNTHSLYCDALPHCQCANFEKINRKDKLSFLELCLYEIIGTEKLSRRSSAYKASRTNYMESKSQLKRKEEFPLFPQKSKFYKGLDRLISSGKKLYRNDFDQYLEETYGPCDENAPEFF